MLRRGINVMIADVRENAIPVAVDALSRHPGRVVGVHADVSVDADVEALADETLERFGRVDLVCNNAGVGPGAADAAKARIDALAADLG